VSFEAGTEWPLLAVPKVDNLPAVRWRQENLAKLSMNKRIACCPARNPFGVRRQGPFNRLSSRAKRPAKKSVARHRQSERIKASPRTAACVLPAPISLLESQTAQHMRERHDACIRVRQVSTEELRNSALRR